jgi:hypothetical protein
MAALLPQSYSTPNTTRSAPRAPSQKEETRTFHYCNKVGHLKAQCHKLQRDMEKKKQQRGDAVVMCAAAVKTFAAVLHSMDANALWYDTAATHHTAVDENLLTNIRPSSIHEVILGGEERHSVKCQGDLRISGGPQLSLRSCHPHCSWGALCTNPAHQSLLRATIHQQGR